jgi:signal peptidase I
VSDDLYIGPTLLEPGPREPRVSGEQVAKVLILPLLALFAVIVLVFFVLYQAVRVDGPSMLPTLRDADRVLITRGAKSVHRGDIVVVIVNEGGMQTELVKRVVGVAGDSVEVRNDVAFVNGAPEPANGQVVDVSQYSISQVPLLVPPGQLYVMGDNRALSEDSRYIGTIPVSGVVGRVVAIFAPIQRARLFE